MDTLEHGSVGLKGISPKEDNLNMTDAIENSTNKGLKRRVGVFSAVLIVSIATIAALLSTGKDLSTASFSNNIYLMKISKHLTTFKPSSKV